MEGHHTTPKYEDKNSDDIFPLTLAEHAEIHRLMALNGENPNGNFWAVKMIVRRMTSEEREEFNKMVKKR